ncbi:MAG: hypothetical protein LBV26_02605 [Bacteroidales bacterium]|nr:hypothetical protein [Bacteroidales bacterium]
MPVYEDIRVTQPSYSFDMSHFADCSDNLCKEKPFCVRGAEHIPVSFCACAS